MNIISVKFFIFIMYEMHLNSFDDSLIDLKIENNYLKYENNNLKRKQ